MKNFEIGGNYIRFEENASKTFHGSLLDLKYEPRHVRHICHSVGDHHETCLIEYYRLYIGRAKEVDAFYFRPNAKRTTNYRWALKRFIVYCPICARLPEESEKLRTVYA